MKTTIILLVLAIILMSCGSGNEIEGGSAEKEVKVQRNAERWEKWKDDIRTGKTQDANVVNGISTIEVEVVIGRIIVDRSTYRREYLTVTDPMLNIIESCDLGKAFVIDGLDRYFGKNMNDADIKRFDKLTIRDLAQIYTK